MRLSARDANPYGAGVGLAVGDGVGEGVGVGLGVVLDPGRPDRTGAMITQRRYHSDTLTVGST
jgi:hypothetical protein